MRLNNNTVLITGGTSGIGYALAKELLARNNTVIICGRREERLREIEQRHPEVHTAVCDVSREDDRQELVSWVTDRFSGLNVLVNNAGIQRDVNFNLGMRDLESEPSEIATNVEAPVYLTARLIPHLRKQKDAVIINVSSVLAFAPMARVPVYCATKAFIHNFTLSLRFQLQQTGISVYEVLPPRVRTELNLEGRKKAGYADTGVDVDEYARTVMDGLEADVQEIEYPGAVPAASASREDLDRMFESINDQTFTWHP